MLRWTRIACLAALFVAVAATTSGAGAASPARSTASVSPASNTVTKGISSQAASRRLALLRTADLSTRAGAWRYLRAVGLNPRHVVIQRGGRNYAGTKCPGKGWTCTTSRQVLQVGAVNLYTCGPHGTGPSPNDCTIVQNGGGTATCAETSSANVTQNCSITQTSTTGNNNAVVAQILTQSGAQGGTQTATQNATVIQNSTRGANNAGVTQNVIQLLGRGAAALNDDPNNADDVTPLTASPISQQQDAYQRLSVVQTSTAAGNNTSGILQTQLQRARADNSSTGITQLQNSAPLDESPCPTLSGADDPGWNPNQCNAVQQTSTGSGKNTSTVRQDYRQFEAASNTPAGQQKQGPNLNQGGLEHRFTQNGTAQASQTSNQVERQVQRRTNTGTLASEQHGPVRKGTGTQTGSPASAKQTQESTQISTPAGPSATQTNVVGDQCTSSGNCSANQTVNQNGVIKTNTQSGTSVSATVTCPASQTCMTTTPPEGSIVVPAGGSSSVQRTFHVPTKPALADIEIAIDTTGSMGGSIAQAQTDAVNIVNGVQAQIPGAQFAVVDFKDAADGALEYRVPQSMTDNAANVQTAINGLTAGGGGDTPEAYNLVFHNSYTPDTAGDIGWRTGSRKFVIVIGDAEPHGAGTAGISGCIDGSADPHSFNTATELAGMNSNERTLFMILANSGSATLGCYQSLAAGAFPGGQGVDAGTNLATQIVSLINTATSTVSNVHLEVASASPAPAAGSWITFTPTSVGPVATNTDQLFTITINVPSGTPPGTYNFDVVGLADGADIGHAPLVVFVP